MPVSMNGICPAESWSSTAVLALDADRPQPAIGERQRERQADPAEADDGELAHPCDAVYVRSERYWRANASTKRGLK